MINVQIMMINVDIIYRTHVCTGTLHPWFEVGLIELVGIALVVGFAIVVVVVLEATVVVVVVIASIAAGGGL